MVRTCNHQAGAEEGKLPNVDEGDGGACVDAEDADAGEGGDHPREEGEEVREGGHLQEGVEWVRKRTKIYIMRMWMTRTNGCMWIMKITVIETAASE